MASPSRRNTASLKEALFERPAAFEFFQAVRLLHKLRKDRASVGRDADPTDEAIRFRSDTSFVFPPGDIRDIEAGEPGEPDVMTVRFLGIASPGSFGSLPTPYIEEIRRQESEVKNPAMREFLDLFNHRLVALFYRAWERSRLVVMNDLEVDNAFERALLGLIGMNGDALAGRLPLDERQLLSRSGLLAMKPTPAAAIEGVVESLLDVPVRVIQFIPSWYQIDDTDENRLGSRNSQLGVDLNLGESVHLVQSRFRVRLGPMGYERFEALLPGSEGFHSLSSVLRLAVGVEFDFEVQLILDAADVPATRLGGDPADAGGRPAQLGRTSWLRLDEFEHDAEGAVFEPALAPEARRYA